MHSNSHYDKELAGKKKTLLEEKEDEITFENEMICRTMNAKVWPCLHRQDVIYTQVSWGICCCFYEVQ